MCCYLKRKGCHICRRTRALLGPLGPPCGREPWAPPPVGAAQPGIGGVPGVLQLKLQGQRGDQDAVAVAEDSRPHVCPAREDREQAAR